MAFLNIFKKGNIESDNFKLDLEFDLSLSKTHTEIYDEINQQTKQKIIEREIKNAMARYIYGDDVYKETMDAINDYYTLVEKTPLEELKSILELKKITKKNSATAAMTNKIEEYLRKKYPKSRIYNNCYRIAPNLTISIELLFSKLLKEASKNI